MSKFTPKGLAGAGAAIVLALSVQGCGAGSAGAARTATPPGTPGGVTAAAPASHGYSPQTLQRAYGVSALLRKGVDRRGETVMLPEAATPVLFSIRPTMTAFDQRYHLPPVDLTSIRGPGYTGPVSGADSEEVEDAEIDQYAHRQLGFLNDGLYRIGHSTQYHQAFHDITHGNNTVTFPSGKMLEGYRTRPGWDPVTGWGTPNAQVLVPLLGKEVHPHDGKGL
jgi:subtilase family serine protease